jgi:hypothetical protein
LPSPLIQSNRPEIIAELDSSLADPRRFENVASILQDFKKPSRAYVAIVSADFESSATKLSRTLLSLSSFSK